MDTRLLNNQLYVIYYLRTLRMYADLLTQDIVPIDLGHGHELLLTRAVRAHLVPVYRTSN